MVEGRRDHSLTALCAACGGRYWDRTSTAVGPAVLC